MMPSSRAVASALPSSIITDQSGTAGNGLRARPTCFITSATCEADSSSNAWM